MAAGMFPRFEAEVTGNKLVRENDSNVSNVSIGSIDSIGVCGWGMGVVFYRQARSWRLSFPKTLEVKHIKLCVFASLR